METTLAVQTEARLANLTFISDLVRTAACKFPFNTLNSPITQEFLKNHRIFLNDRSLQECSHFNDTDPKYPAYQFLKDVQFFHPQKSLLFPVKPVLCFRGFELVPEEEFLFYSSLAREFQPGQDDIQAVLDFWKGVSNRLPKLSQFAKNYAFLNASSCSVKRLFSYYNKLLRLKGNL